MSRNRALLIYKNSSPEIMEWAVDIAKRTKEANERRWAWATKLWDDAGVPQDDPEDKKPTYYDRRWKRGVRVFDSGALAGLEWPRDMDDKLPPGWFRPVKEPHLVRPRGGARYSALNKEFQSYRTPSMRDELQRKFGMEGRTFAGMSLYSCGIRIEKDGVWVTWGSLDVTTEKWTEKLPEFGWERVSMVDYLLRFGEKILEEN